jgi:hypothetical protein
MTSPDDTDEPPPDDWSPEDPDYDDPTNYSIIGSEPIVGVPAGLLGTAIELLDLCDELLNRPGSKAIDVHVSEVIRRYQRADLVTLRWLHNGLSSTAWRLLELLNNEGIVIEPELHGRHGLLYHP